MLDNNRKSHQSGYMVLFRLGIAGEKLDEDTIGIGENARYGALVENGCLTPLRLDAVKGYTASSLNRLVSVVMLDDNDPGYSEVLDEVDRFLDKCGSKESENSKRCCSVKGRATLEAWHFLLGANLLSMKPSSRTFAG